MSSLLILSLLFTVALTQNITSDDFDVGNITLFNGRSKSFPPFDNEPVITVKEGKIKGMKTKMKDGFTFYSFLGVPYASKPERFQAPVPPKSWGGVRDALKEGEACFQYVHELKKNLGSEDCLYANIHTPNIKGNSPIIIWVFGGAFNFGIGSPYLWGPDKLLRKGAVVIFFNYRLGVFGFLSSKTKDAPGNAGLKDIVALIKWVKSNAKSFGGDPYSITLFGGSSGAAAIDYVTLSPMSEDLFERIILTSGTASNFWGFSEDPLKWTFKLGRKLNINTNNVNVLMENLKNVSPSMLALAAEQIDKRDTSHPFSLIFVPCAESIIDGEKSIITKSPTSILKTGNYYKVPQIISFTNNEGYTYLEQMKKNLNNLDSMLELLIPKTILKRLTGAKMKNEILKRIKQFYFKGSKITNATLQNFVDFLSDTIILYDLHNNLKVKLKHNTNPIYYTEFGYEMKKKTPRKHVPKDNLSFESLPRKVGHGDDLAYVFTFSQEMIADDDIVTKKVVDRQVTMIYNFAKYGDPTPFLNDIISVKWNPVNSILETEYLNITQKIQMKTYPNKKRYKFWDDIYSFIGKK